ncbi:MAG TPA: flippase-like domain-containing protein [candidate division Zixibacteria bacterium]|nr:flippase-like domain-containing protein [candidate division Zixibacteria bacterium]
MPDKNLKQIIIRLIKWILIALILYFIYRQISAQWEQVKEYDWTINWIYFVLSIIILQIGLFYKSYLWSRVLACFGTHLPPMRAFKVAYLSNLGRYVPGKIVQFAGIMYLARKEGVREDVAVSSFALTQLFDTPAGIIAVFLYYFLLGTSYDKISNYLPLTIVLGAVSILGIAVIMVPALLERTLNLMLRVIRKPALEFKLEKKIGFGFLFLYFIAWNIFGFSFYLFLQAVAEVPVNYFAEACFIYTAAYLIGYWALFAPGGIGVREGVMGALLYEVGGVIKSVAYTVGLAARLWFFIGEITITFLALMVRSRE